MRSWKLMNPTKMVDVNSEPRTSCTQLRISSAACDNNLNTTCQWVHGGSQQTVEVQLDYERNDAIDDPRQSHVPSIEALSSVCRCSIYSCIH